MSKNVKQAEKTILRGSEVAEELRNSMNPDLLNVIARLWLKHASLLIPQGKVNRALRKAKSAREILSSEILIRQNIYLSNKAMSEDARIKWLLKHEKREQKAAKMLSIGALLESYCAKAKGNLVRVASFLLRCSNVQNSLPIFLCQYARIKTTSSTRWA